MIDTSTIPAKGPDVRSITKQTIVLADPMTVWTAWTSSAEIGAWWGPPASNIDLRVGGPFELLFDQAAQPGTQGSEGCKYLGYVPGEMISFTWNAPPHLTLRSSNTWVVITFSRESDHTRVRLVHTGFLTGSDWDDYMSYFDDAWGFVLARLTDHWA
jgi:uncharacterized protein YndB with AHSA1/START domain